MRAYELLKQKLDIEKQKQLGKYFYSYIFQKNKRKITSLEGIKSCQILKKWTKGKLNSQI